MLYANIMCNYPSWIYLLMRLAKLVLPKKLMEKVLFCGGNQSEGDIRDCPFVSTKMGGAERIPSFLGGKCRCPGGCVPGIDNDAACEYRVVTVEEVAPVVEAIRVVREAEEKAKELYCTGVPIQDCFKEFQHHPLRRFLPFCNTPAQDKAVENLKVAVGAKTFHASGGAELGAN